jgi:hypothetical protein
MDVVVEYATEILAFVYIIIAPAMMMGKVLYPNQRRALRFAIGLAVHLAVTPLAAFSLAMIMETVVSTRMLLVLATVIILGGLLLQLTHLRRRTQVLEE